MKKLSIGLLFISQVLFSVHAPEPEELSLIVKNNLPDDKEIYLSITGGVNKLRSLKPGETDKIFFGWFDGISIYPYTYEKNGNLYYRYGDFLYLPKVLDPIIKKESQKISPVIKNQYAYLRKKLNPKLEGLVELQEENRKKPIQGIIFSQGEHGLRVDAYEEGVTINPLYRTKK